MQRNDGQPKRQRSDKKTLTSKEIKMAGYLYGSGFTIEEVAHACDMSKRTFERYRAETPELDDALLKGKAKVDGAVIQSAYQQATSGKSPTMTIFWLKTRRGWKENDGYDDSQEKFKRPPTLTDDDEKKPVSDSSH